MKLFTEKITDIEKEAVTYIEGLVKASPDGRVTILEPNPEDEDNKYDVDEVDDLPDFENRVDGPGDDTWILNVFMDGEDLKVTGLTKDYWQETVSRLHYMDSWSVCNLADWLRPKEEVSDPILRLADLLTEHDEKFAPKPLVLSMGSSWGTVTANAETGETLVLDVEADGSEKCWFKDAVRFDVKEYMEWYRKTYNGEEPKVYEDEQPARYIYIDILDIGWWDAKGIYYEACESHRVDMHTEQEETAVPEQALTDVKGTLTSVNEASNVDEDDILKEGWVVITPTVVDGDIMSWATGENGVEIPDVYDTEEAAWKEIADAMVQELNDFIDGNRELEDTNFATEEYVAAYTEYKDGEIFVSDEQGNPIIETTIEEWRKKR